MRLIQRKLVQLAVLKAPRSLSAAAASGSPGKGSQKCDIVIVGGGTGGSAVAHKFARALGKDRVTVIEPWKNHYYQPMWTLVGGGLKTIEQSRKPHESILNTCNFINDYVTKLDPDNNMVITKSGQEITYKYLVMATGIRPNYHTIKGLPEAFETPGVCSNYRPEWVRKTYPAIQDCKKGEAIFTFPKGPIKCAGAPQKIAYLADARFRQVCQVSSQRISNGGDLFNFGVRDKIKMRYMTALPAIFGVKHYAEILNKVAAEKDIEVNTRHNLIEVKPDTKEAIFEILDENNEQKSTVAYKYSMLHVGPRCDPRPFVKDSPLSNDVGFVTVDKHTLQHTKYPNVFGLGDCTDSPNAKTAAAVAGQCQIVNKNLQNHMKGKPMVHKYDGYASCPIPTSLNKLILAEFDYNLQPLETFPIDQRRQSRLMYFLKVNLMPDLYWHGLCKGYWNGPGFYRKLLHLGMSR